VKSAGQYLLVLNGARIARLHGRFCGLPARPVVFEGIGARDSVGEARSGARRSQAGYAMAALLVSLSVMAVMLTVIMPVWKHMMQREKEAELVFRGEQYARAIGLFQRKFANAYPPNVDALVEQRFLRRKYKDPITGDDFAVLTQGQGAQAPGTTPGTAQGGQPGAGGATMGGIATSRPSVISGASGGVLGVVSKSKAESIRVYNGHNHYNEWVFQYLAQTQAPGVQGAPGGRAGPGPQGQPSNQPIGQPGMPMGPGGGQGRGRGGPQGNPPPNPGNPPARGTSPFGTGAPSGPGMPGGTGRGR
jgi:type II secretory pathway pseudopilin PulG